MCAFGPFKDEVEIDFENERINKGLLLVSGDTGAGKTTIFDAICFALYGQASDLEIQAREIVKTKEISAEILGKNCGKSKDKVLKDLDRDYWMDSKESIEYGIVDGIFKFPKKK